MPSFSIKQFSSELRKLELDLNLRAEIALRETAKQSVPIVRKELRNAATREGTYPLIASKKMYASTRWNRVVSKNGRRRIVANVGVFTSYAAALEYGAGPFTPPLGPLIEWAKYKVAAAKRKKTAGRARGTKIRARSGGERPVKAKGVPRLNRSGNREARRMAYLVQQKIKRKGILPRFYMAKSMVNIEKRAVSNLRKQGRKLRANYPVKFTVRRLA